MSEQSDKQSPSTDVCKIGTHLSVTQMKTVVRGSKVGPAEPPLKPVQVHFGGKAGLILLMVVWHVSFYEDGGNRPPQDI